MHAASPTPTPASTASDALRNASSNAPAGAFSTPQTPGIWRRMAAWLYEGVLLFGVVMAVALPISVLGRMDHALEHRSSLQAVVFIAIGLYFIWCWHKGQTLAMKTWHMRVTSRDGGPLTPWRAALRYLLAWVWFAPLLAAAWLPLNLGWQAIALVQAGWVAIWALLARMHPRRQFWHDAWSGTQLVHHRQGRRISPARGPAASP